MGQLFQQPRVKVEVFPLWDPQQADGSENATADGAGQPQISHVRACEIYCQNYFGIDDLGAIAWAIATEELFSTVILSTKYTIVTVENLPKLINAGNKRFCYEWGLLHRPGQLDTAEDNRAARTHASVSTGLSQDTDPLTVYGQRHTSILGVVLPGARYLG
jgi:hypothetical protein